MASSKLRRQPLQLEPVESVSADATVRHVDQLETETLDRFYTALENDGSIADTAPGLEEGEIIVFTDYYQVVRP